MTKQTWLTEIERLLPSGTVVHDQRGVIEVDVPCKNDHRVTVPLGTRTHPNHLVKIMKNKGWALRASKGTCPDCVEKARAEKAAKAAKKKDEPVKLETKEQATVNAKSAKRLALLMIEDVFDENAGRYKDDHSDKTVAKETGLSESAVAKLREEFGFEIKEPPEFAQWREEIERLERNMKAVTDGIEEKIAKLRADAEDAVKALAHQHLAVRTKIEDTISEQGW